MNRRYYYISILLLIILGATLGVIYFPRYNQVSLMLIYGSHYQEALNRYESRVNQSSLPISVLMPRVWLDLKLGNVEEAVGFVENYVHTHPHDIEARTYLGKLYQDTSKLYEYLLNLRKLYDLQPSVKLLREMLAYYNLYDEVANQIETLQEIVQHYAAQEDEYQKLAYFYAANGNTADAIQIVFKMLNQIPIARLNSGTLQFTVSLLARNGYRNDAYLVAKDYLMTHFNPKGALNVLYVLSDEKMYEESFALLSVLPDQWQTISPLFSFRISLLLAAGEQKKAGNLLVRSFERNLLPANLIENLFEYILDQRDFGLLTQIVKTIPLYLIPERLLIRTLEIAVTEKQEAFIHALAQSTDSTYLEEHPFLASLFTLVLTPSSPEEEQTLIHFYSFSSESEAHKAVLAQIFYAKGYGQLAQKVLESIHSLLGMNREEAVSAAYLYINFHMIDKGIKLIERALQESPADHSYLENAWIILLAADGRTQQVLEWVDAHPDIEQQTLTDVFYSARDNQNGFLAIQIATRLFNKWPIKAHKKMLAQAFLVNKQEEPALKLFRELAESGDNIWDDYIYALSLVVKNDPRYRFELKKAIDRQLATQQHFTQKRLREFGYLLFENAYRDEAAAIFIKLAANKPFNDPDVQALLSVWGEHPTPQALAWITLHAQKTHELEKAKWVKYLVDVGAAHEALGLISQMDLHNGDVIKAYQYALENQIYKLFESTKYNWADRAELKDWIRVELDLPFTSAKRKRELAYLLIERQWKQEAIHVFLSLAEKQPFSSQDVQALLNLWGPKPNLEAVAWIKERTQAVRGKEKGKWLKYLLDIQLSKVLVTLVDQKDLQEDSIIDVYIDALNILKMHRVLETVLAQVLENETRPARLKKLGKIALANDLQNTAQNLYAKVLSVAPHDAESLQQMGLILFGKGSYSKAEYYLLTYLEEYEGDYRTNDALAEILYNHKEKEQSYFYFKRALAQIHELDKTDRYIQQMEAQIYYHLKENQTAIAIYKELLAQYPSDLSLRTEYASLLMDLQYYKCAALILAYEPETCDLKRVKKEVRINYAIARLRLLKEERYLNAAFCFATQLLEIYPCSAELFAAIADLELTLSRWRLSLAFLQEAQILKPENENYATTINQVLKDYRSFIYLASEIRYTGLTQNEFFKRFIGEVNVFSFTKLIVYAEQDHIEIDPYINLQGKSVRFKGNRERFEISLRHYFEKGNIIRGSFFVASEDVLGTGFELTGFDVLGSTDIVIDYHRPNWDFVQTTIEGGSRDRLRLFRSLKLWPLWTIEGAVAINQYNLKGFSGAVQTRSGEALVSYELSKHHPIKQFLGDDASFRLNYALDTEYADKIRRKRDLLGVLFAPIPFINRQQHLLFLAFSKTFWSWTTIEAFGGYMYDRAVGGPLNPLYGFSFVMEPNDDLVIRFDYIHGTSPVGGGVVDRFIFSAKYRF